VKGVVAGAVLWSSASGRRFNFRPLSATANLTPWTVMNLLAARLGTMAVGFCR